MNIALVTIAYNGYGRYIDQWLDAIARSKTLPDQIIIVLGKDHDYSNQSLILEKYSELNIKLVYAEGVKAKMGRLRNFGVKHTTTEWVMYLSVDDILMPEAIDEFARLENQADYICISWYSRALWRAYEVEPTFHRGKTPEYLYKMTEGRGFIVSHSPYRRKFWELSPYMDHDYPNAPFLADMILNGARFVSTKVPCTTYLKRFDSHAAKLGRRGRYGMIKSEKVQAVKWKRHLEEVIRTYYAKKRVKRVSNKKVL